MQPLTPCWPSMACWSDLRHQQSRECVLVKAKTLLIITRANLTSSVAASGIRCVCMLSGPCLPCDFEPPLICSISASELIGPAQDWLWGRRKPRIVSWKNAALRWVAATKCWDEFISYRAYRAPQTQSHWYMVFCCHQIAWKCQAQYLSTRN